MTLQSILLVDSSAKMLAVGVWGLGSGLLRRDGGRDLHKK